MHKPWTMREVVQEIPTPSFRYRKAVASVLLGLVTTLSSVSFGANDQCTSQFRDPRSVLQTKYGDVTLTSETAIALRLDQLELQSAMKLRGPEKLKALLQYAKQKTQSRVNVGLTYANYAVAMLIGHQIVVKLAENPNAIPATVALIPACLVAADAVSSGYHYFLDNWAKESSRIWGSPARAFRRHHEVPSNLNELSYVQNVSAFSKLMAPLYVATAVASPHLAPEVQTQALMFLLLFSNGTEIHRQAHLPKTNPIVQSLQKTRIFLDKKVHGSHHTRPTDSDYGIINGLSNPVMNPLYRWIDRVAAKHARRLPNTWIQDPRGIPPEVLNELMIDLSRVPQELVVAINDSKHSRTETDQLLRLWVERFGDSTSEEARP
jgi:hypothetical protein